jgi:tetratricopeptide (TPR) repeat protein
LIGPEAAAQAPPPADLPAKDAAKLCLRTAQEYEKFKKIDEAINLYEKARASDASVAKIASRRLAVLYDLKGEFSKSAAEYEALLKANPKDADLHNDLGYSYYCRGDWSNAEQCLGKAVQLDPNHKRAWVNLGMALGQQSRWHESYDAFCKAVRPADAHSNIAFLLMTQGKTEEAKGEYKQALALDPDLRAAQAGLTRLENPHASRATTSKSEPYDPEVAASRVPTIAEIEARMKMESATKTVTAASAEGASYPPATAESKSLEPKSAYEK